MGLFPVLGGKIFSVAAREVARRWSARTAARRSGRLRCACGWTFLGERGWTFLGACGWTRWRLCMFNLIYHLLPKNHKWNRCSSGRVSVDSAAFFGYKFGYKILNSRKSSGSAGAKQLTNNLRMDAMNGSDGRDERCGWTRWTVRMDAMDSSDARSCARHMVRPFGWQFSTGCFLRMAPDTRGGGASGKFTGGIAIQYIFARKIFGILANDNKRIKTNRAIGRISHIVVRWLRQGTVFTAPLIFSRG